MFHKFLDFKGVVPWCKKKKKMDGKLADRVIRPIIAFVDKVRLAVIGHSIGKSPTLFASRDVKNRDNRNREHRTFGETGIIVWTLLSDFI